VLRLVRLEEEEDFCFLDGVGGEETDFEAGSGEGCVGFLRFSSEEEEELRLELDVVDELTDSLTFLALVFVTGADLTGGKDFFDFASSTSISSLLDELKLELELLDEDFFRFRLFGD